MIALTKNIKDTKILSDLPLAYLNGKLKDLYHFENSLDGIKEAITYRESKKINREVLVANLLEQNKNVHESAIKNIGLLSKENTFTVTTGHQLNIFTGPLFFIYKIAHAIKLANELKEKFKDKNFIPVYWMATEDHDFDEISEINLFSKKMKWETKQSGAVGRMKLDELNNVLSEVRQILGNSDVAINIYDFIQNAYKKATLSEATRYLVDKLFGEYGLVIIDADNSQLKNQLKLWMQKEINESFVEQTVLKTNAEIEKKGFKTQVNPRDINLFYIKDNYRERITRDGEEYITADKKYSWRKDEIYSEIDNSPENFSPNVLMRALYQETILPNIVYIGGGGEISYWLQMKKMFEEANLKLPVLMIRNSFLWMDTNTKEKWEKLGFSNEDIFLQEHELTQLFIERNTEDEIKYDGQRNELKNTFNKLKQKVVEIDATLENSVDAELQKALKSIDIIEAKSKKAIKIRHENSLKQIQSCKEKFYPEGNLQERHENFLSVYLKSNGNFIRDIIQNSEGLNASFKIMVY